MPGRMHRVARRFPCDCNAASARSFAPLTMTWYLLDVHGFSWVEMLRYFMTPCTVMNSIVILTPSAQLRACSGRHLTAQQHAIKEISASPGVALCHSCIHGPIRGRFRPAPLHVIPQSPIANPHPRQINSGCGSLPTRCSSARSQSRRYRRRCRAAGVSPRRRCARDTRR